MTVKSTAFRADLQEIAQIAKVLAHPARLAILKYLSEIKTCISGDIANELPLSRTTVSQHLNELKRMGFIKGEISGTRVNYCINQKVLQAGWQKLDNFYKNIQIDPELSCDC